MFTIEIPENIITKIYNLKNSTKFVKLRSNVNGWQSKQYTSIDDVIWAKELILKCLDILNLSDYEIRQFWFNINPKGAYHNWHSHGKTLNIVVCYIKVPKNSGNIEFKIDNIVHSIEPVEGMLLTFPPGTDHRVLPNETDEDRISMAINLSNIR